MIRKIVEEIAWTVSMNLEAAKLRLSSVGRQYYRDGFDAGYKAGRAHAASSAYCYGERRVSSGAVS